MADTKMAFWWANVWYVNKRNKCQKDAHLYKNVLDRWIQNLELTHFNEDKKTLKTTSLNMGLCINYTAKESETVYLYIINYVLQHALIFCLLAKHTYIFCVWIIKKPVKLDWIWYGMTPSCQRRLRSPVAARRVRNVRGNLL